MWRTQRYFRQIYLIRELWRFLQPGLISMNFQKELGLSNVNHERMYKLIMDLIPDDWKHIGTLNWNFSKMNKGNKSTRKVKICQRLSNKEILEQTFHIYISWLNLMNGRKPYVQSLYWEKMFYWLFYQMLYMVAFSMSGIHFSIFLPLNCKIHKNGSTLNILCQEGKRWVSPPILPFIAGFPKLL